MSAFYDVLPDLVCIEQRQEPVNEHKKMLQNLTAIQICPLPNVFHL